jgi:hypothetical protein
MKAFLIFTAALFIAGVQAMPAVNPSRLALKDEPTLPRHQRPYYDDGVMEDGDRPYRSTPREQIQEEEAEYEEARPSPEMKFNKKIRGANPPRIFGPQQTPDNVNGGPLDVP